MVEEPIEERGHGRGIAEELAPVVDGPVRGEERARPLVAPHDEFEQVLGGRGRELAHAEVVDDRGAGRWRARSSSPAGAVDAGLGEFIEEAVRLAVEDAVALLDGGVADRLGEMALAGAGRAEEERVFALRDEAAGGELEDEGPVELLVEVEIEGVEGLVGVAEAGVGPPAGEEPILAADELIADERRDEVERRQPFGLRLAEPGLQDVGHAGEAELAEGAIEFGQGHSGVSCSALAIEEIAVVGELADQRIDLA